MSGMRGCFEGNLLSLHMPRQQIGALKWLLAPIDLALECGRCIMVGFVASEEDSVSIHSPVNFSVSWETYLRCSARVKIWITVSGCRFRFFSTR